MRVFRVYHSGIVEVPWAIIAAYGLFCELPSSCAFLFLSSGWGWGNCAPREFDNPNLQETIHYV